jgi:hypothetical protein
MFLGSRELYSFCSFLKYSINIDIYICMITYIYEYKIFLGSHELYIF